jgi:apolipoprotein N-acyltransferase
VNLGWLGWFATIPWLVLALRTDLTLTRRDWWMLWCAGFLHWAALLQGVRLANPALYPGWIALSAYLAVYLPLFIAGGRCLLRQGCPAWLALPAAWVAMEYVRAFFATGFSTASLSHTQVENPLLLQIADLAGAYTLSFLMVLVTTAGVMWWPQCQRSRRECMWGSGIALACLLATLGYGRYRLQGLPPLADSSLPAVRVLLVQGNMDTVLDNNPDRPREMIQHYRQLTFAHLDSPAVKQAAPYDVIVWPESACALVDYIAEEDLQPPPAAGVSREEFQANLASHQVGFTEMLHHFSSRFNEPAPGTTHFITGCTTVHFRADQIQTYNSALFISPAGKPLSRYFKTHLVMFGEYIPVAEWFPWIYQLTPLPGGLSRGQTAEVFQLQGLKLAPNVCFESTVPHLIRRQIQQLKRNGNEPDILINTTNDGWFYGSAILDLHFQSAVLRAVENRKPFLIAANTGISGVINGNGQVLQRGPNHATALLSAEIRADGRQSLYHTVGDWPAFLCCLVTFGALWRGWHAQRAAA